MKKSLFSLSTLGVLIASGLTLAAGDTSAARPMTASELKTYGDKALVAFRNVRSLRAAAPGAEQQAVSGHFDEQGVPFVRAKQQINGIRIWGGDLVFKGEGAENMTFASGELASPEFAIGTTPAFSSARALSIARRAEGATMLFANAPQSELVIYPIYEQTVKSEFRSANAEDLNAEQMEQKLTGVRLAYHVTAFTRELIIDANNGDILMNVSALRQVDATLNCIYLKQQKGTNTQSGTSYTLKDPVRGFTLYDIAFGTSINNALAFPADYNNDNIWGDGKQFNGSKVKNTANYQTAAAEVYKGVQVTYDLLKNVFNYKGINGLGKMPKVGVHLGDSTGKPYDNAFYSANTLSFGDGYKVLNSLTDIGVVAHEFAHGICANESSWVYKGESGGLNESNSDIFGEMAEAYLYGASSTGAVVPNNGCDWLNGATLVKPAKPMRYYIKPSKDGKSPDEWTTNAPNVEVHAGSGPNNRAFYYMCVGGQGTDATKDDYSKRFSANKNPWKGMGNDKALRIWFKQLRDYATSNDTYAKARANCLKAATDLYGANSREYRVVAAAYAGINVGTDNVKID